MCSSMSFVAGLVAIVLLPVVSGQEDKCCDVVAFAAEELAADGTWTFAASMSSLYEVETGWDQYCHFFEVRTVPTDNTTAYTVLGKRVVGHPHPTEQPFTRRVRDVTLPADVDTIVAVAHDTINGFCGSELRMMLSGSAPTSVTAPPSPATSPTPASSTSDPSTSGHHGGMVSLHVFTFAIACAVALYCI